MELLSYKKKHLVNLSTLHGALGTDGRIPELQKIRVSIAIPHGGLRTMKQRYNKSLWQEFLRLLVSIPHGGLRTPLPEEFILYALAQSPSHTVGLERFL
jgi:hypothetical protein